MQHRVLQRGRMTRLVVMIPVRAEVVKNIKSVVANKVLDPLESYHV